MKRNILYLAGALLSSAILMFGCSEDIPTYSELTVDKTEVFIQADGENPTTTVNITEGNDNYKISVADENIASATLDGTRIIINGLRNGTTTATVMDWTKHSAVITIKVKEDFELKLDKEEVTLFLDEEEKNTVLINILSGNGDYQVESSNNEVATAELTKEGKILITALSSDFCDITVTDADGNKATVKVGVCDEHLVLEDITGKACVINQTMDIQITSGNGNYSAISESPEIATIDGDIVDGVIRIKGVSKGEASITVTDRMGLTATVKVRVAGDFEVETTEIDKLWIGEELEIAIIDGSGNYTIDSGSSMTCTLSEDKSKLVINGIDKQLSLNQTITVTDNLFGTSIVIHVKYIDYPFDVYGTARWYIDGAFGQPGASEFTTKGTNPCLKVGQWYKPLIGSGYYRNGYALHFENGLEVGVKGNGTLSHLNNSGKEENTINVTDVEIVKTDEITEEGKGKFWIRFHEPNKEEYSYIITWT